MDVEHLGDDVEELKKLFFRAKVPMQVRWGKTQPRLVSASKQHAR